jgi:hypothetical protein
MHLFSLFNENNNKQQQQQQQQQTAAHDGTRRMTMR